MNEKFIEILNKQESEDNFDFVAEEKLLEILKTEYENYNEIIAFIKNELKITATEALKLESFELDGKIIAVRKEKLCKIRKHTAYQRPYFHSHDFYEFIYVLKGNCRQKVGVNLELETLNSGDLCLLCRGEIHSLARAGNHDVILKIDIPIDVFLKSIPKSKDNYNGRIYYRGVSSQAEFIILKMLDEYNRNDKFSQYAISNYLSLLLIELERKNLQKFNRIVIDLDNYLENNLKNASLTDFSKMIGYNAVYAGRLIKSYSNMTFTEILIEKRMCRAIELLREDNLSIDEISYQVGYSSATGLYKQFYAKYGMTPLMYKNLL